MSVVLLLPIRTWAESDCDGTILEMTACLEQEYKQLDSRLNQLYKRVLDRVNLSGGKNPRGGDKNVSNLFVKAHKTWLSFRDEECKARSGYFSEGSMEKLELMGCRAELTRDRIKLLENWLELLER